MATIYSNENIRIDVVEILRRFGHDVLSSFEAGKANQRIPDELVLKFAIENSRAVLTYNRKDYMRLHRLTPNHAGIIVCKEEFDDLALAQRIHDAIEAADGNLSNPIDSH